MIASFTMWIHKIFKYSLLFSFYILINQQLIILFGFLDPRSSNFGIKTRTPNIPQKHILKEIDKFKKNEIELRLKEIKVQKNFGSRTILGAKILGEMLCL